MKAASQIFVCATSPFRITAGKRRDQQSGSLKLRVFFCIQSTTQQKTTLDKSIVPPRLSMVAQTAVF
jgi:hypothetical protein